MTSVEKDELTRLRREVEILRDKKVLRKAAVFFARETDQPR